ncbi:hypothetical protein SUDANB121_00710 [Nocardiopsis dassonvillei]|uniref:abortive infection system antitoxin AbiGi family protein n=1 Tax=Nocardiopsis dassonvillei TaxID=2014 RepID=UPI003F552293
MSTPPRTRTIEELLHRRSDLSTFLVHLSRNNQGKENDARDNLLSILVSRRISATSFFGVAEDQAKQVPEVAETQRVVCFSETPIEHVWMMCEQIPGRSVQLKGYGLAITKVYARSRGVNPVWYVDQTPSSNSPTWLTKAFKALVEQAEVRALVEKDTSDQSYGELLAESPVLKLTPFIEPMGTYNVAREFWWEREWRHVGDFRFLAPEDIIVAFVPEADQEAFRRDLTALIKDELEDEEPFDWGVGEPLRQDYYEHLVFVDATWSLEHMIASIAGAKHA